jgi:hypothetical protein
MMSIRMYMYPTVRTRGTRMPRLVPGFNLVRVNPRHVSASMGDVWRAEEPEISEINPELKKHEPARKRGVLARG